jgi:hypothetical protein
MSTLQYHPEFEYLPLFYHAPRAETASVDMSGPGLTESNNKREACAQRASFRRCQDIWNAFSTGSSTAKQVTSSLRISSSACSSAGQQTSLQPATTLAATGYTTPPTWWPCQVLGTALVARTRPAYNVLKHLDRVLDIKDAQPQRVNFLQPRQLGEEVGVP